MPRPQDHGDEPQKLTLYMRAVRDGAPAEEIARLRLEYRQAVVDRKRRDTDAYLAEAEAELQAAGHDAG